MKWAAKTVRKKRFWIRASLAASLLDKAVSQPVPPWHRPSTPAPVLDTFAARHEGVSCLSSLS